MTEPARRYSPAAERNRQVILAELQRRLPAHSRVLEVASGSGQHAAHFAAAMPAWHWQPTDGDAQALASIDDWCAGLPQVAPALALDVQAPHWPGVPQALDAVFCANLLHIAPWAACAGLMQGAARHVCASGQVLLYGPFVVDGQPLAPSNQAFDADLRQRNPHWGLRAVSQVQAEAHQAGWRLQDSVGLPANNLLLVFART